MPVRYLLIKFLPAFQLSGTRIYSNPSSIFTLIISRLRKSLIPNGGTKFAFNRQRKIRGTLRVKLLAKTMLVMSLAFVASNANAVPILYNTNFSATVGPNGTGSFKFDNTTGVLSDFTWDFGDGIVGGIQDQGPSLVFGDTRGRWLFEILTEIDTHSGKDCTNDCGLHVGVIGSAPASATNIGFSGEGNTADYIFHYGLVGNPDPNHVQGVVTVSAVPVPATIVLFSLGLVCIGLFRRSLAGGRKNGT